ncbi:MAG: hypothetical protein IJU19_02195 [Bacteroidales bacterium]|nr:hypothetical protein [Bacteroidales bacterium]
MKHTLLLLFVIGQFTLALSQTRNAYADKTLYLSLRGGAYLYSHSTQTQFGLPALGFDIGRWIMRPLSFQTSFDYFASDNHTDSTSKTNHYFMASAEFRWDVNATLHQVHTGSLFMHPCPVYPMIGLGLLWRDFSETDQDLAPGADNDFQAMLGLQLPMRLSNHWTAFLETKCTFFPQHFDASNGDNYFFSFLLGTSYQWSDNPFHRSTTYESKELTHDWFVGFGGGTQISSFEFEYAFDSKAKLWTFTPELIFGRNFSNVWTIRFELSGFSARERYNEDQEAVGIRYAFNYLHTDFMINLSRLTRFRPGSRLNFMPYMGAGPIWRYQSPAYTVAADAGLLTRYYIDPAGDLYLDLKYTMTPPRVAGDTGPSGSIYGVGYPSLTLGYLYNFSRTSTRYRMPLQSSKECISL